MKKNVRACAVVAALIFALGGCSQKSSEKTIAVFVPGIIDDSPVYSMLVSGIKTALEENNAAAENGNGGNAEKVSLFVRKPHRKQPHSCWKDVWCLTAALYNDHSAARRRDSS